MKVAVYFNLHKKTFSVKALEGDKKGRVIMHTDNIVLENVKFKVSEAGRQRVINEKRKNVHAYVIGNVVSFDTKEVSGSMITYNPYYTNTFVEKFDRTPIHTSQKAWLICENKKPQIFAKTL